MKFLGSAVVACAAFALAGCGGGSSAPNNNPAAATVYVTQGGAPAANISVTLSTSISQSAPTGVIATQTTNSSGYTTFGGLPQSEQLCASAVIANSIKFDCEYPFPVTTTLAF